MELASEGLAMKAKEAEGNGIRRIRIDCPGCKESHVVPVEGPKAWGFNGNLEAPTLTPSILVTSGHFLSEHKEGDNCWCTYNAKNKDNHSPFKCTRCHSFVTDGKIQFLSDSTHSLAGQTVDLPEIESATY
jgi:hypothetical protein